MLTKKKRRSGHGIFSSHRLSSISGPSDLVKLSGMGSVEEPIPAISNSAITGTHGKDAEIAKEAVAEPLMDDMQVHNGDQDESVQESTTLPVDRSSAYQPLGSHPVQKYPDEDDETAPPPPDFTRRGIHIPMRTRYVMIISQLNVHN
jgi:hypothetical protein